MNNELTGNSAAQPFHQELAALKEQLVMMGRLAESAVRQALKALVERNDALARQCRDEDEIIDSLEVKLDDAAITLLTKAPLASDLRLIAVAMKICHNLERVGDEATTIARQVLELNAEPQLKPYIDLPSMAEIALGMLREALDAFITRQPGQARAIIPRDKQVDALNRQLHRELLSYMVEDGRSTSRCLNLMVISKSLERIADHATNIAEQVVYLYEGRDIRHTGKGAATLGATNPKGDPQPDT
ncbi:MAG: phosphate signaling complex protein PhoU [Candidatus Omnitrophica bacterium]|nr:phosphate signaling complex protein PhoU [Candidatus Omnitrophota bacterium]